MNVPGKAIVAVTSTAAAFRACDSGPLEQAGDPQLTLSPDSVVVGVFESFPLTATVRDARGSVRHVDLQYVSRDRSVATVSADGAIRAVAAGSTHVVATLLDRRDVRDSVRVRVHADSCTGARPDAAELHAAAPDSADVRWYQAGHNIDQQAVVDRLRWLHERIGLDAPAGG